MKNVIPFLIFLLAVSCSDKQSTNSKIYYIIKNKEYSFNDDNPPPPPPMFYGKNNFILLQNGKIYYHNKFGYIDNLTYPNDYQKQPFLNLKISDFKLIGLKNLEHFLESEVNDTTRDGLNETLVIKSQTDTIRNPAFPIIKDFLKKRGLKRYDIRIWTEEEARILKTLK